MMSATGNPTYTGQLNSMRNLHGFVFNSYENMKLLVYLN